MIFKADFSQLLTFEFDSSGSKIPKFPEFNLVMNSLELTIWVTIRLGYFMIKNVEGEPQESSIQESFMWSLRFQIENLGHFRSFFGSKNAFKNRYSFLKLLQKCKGLLLAIILVAIPASYLNAYSIGRAYGAKYQSNRDNAIVRVGHIRKLNKNKNPV